MKSILLLVIYLEFFLNGCNSKELPGGLVVDSGISKRHPSKSISDDDRKNVEIALNHMKASLNTFFLNRKPELKNEILQREDDFPVLLKACSVYSPYKVEFFDIYKVSNDKYIIKLQCTMGAYQPEYAYFFMRGMKAEILSI